MRIAVLITNTDFSTFAQSHPDDGEKFSALINEVRPNWICEPFWVCKDQFPDDISAFDGVLITGSPASVNDEAPWMVRLEALILDMIAARQPLFGACFGHQAIAKALGAKITRNPAGWNHGRLEINRVGQTPWSGTKTRLALYGSHIEHVEALPDGAVTVFEGPTCPIAGFTYLDSVFTVQHHPEMTHGFIEALAKHYADYVGEDVTTAALASLKQAADRTEFAEEMARFFEYASVAYKL